MLMRLLRDALGGLSARPRSEEPGAAAEEVRRLIEAGDLDAAARLCGGLPPGTPGAAALMLALAAKLDTGDRREDAERWAHAVLEIEPYNREALLRIAMRRYEESDTEQARILLERCPREPALRLRRALTMPVILDSNAHVDSIRERFDAELDELIDAKPAQVERPEHEIGMTGFYLAYHGRNNAALLRKLARVCRALHPGRTECTRRPFASGKRVRIGFVSTFFHHHSVARTTYGLIRDLPRPQFEVSVFAVDPRADEWSDAVRAAADRYAALPTDLPRVRDAIDAAALDVLLFADIGMHPLTYFLSFWRLAPVQLATWGHSMTSGVDTVDWYVSSDAVESPGSEAQYTERLMRLPGYFMPRYRRPVLDGPPRPRSALGLPGDAHVYYCPQNLFKLHPDFDATLLAILERDPAAGILLQDTRRSWSALVRRRLARTLGAQASRVHFVGRMPPALFLHYIAAADVILDPFHFGGCNSSCEALSLGVPVVTLPSPQLPGRFTMGLYREIGMEDMIATTPEQYVDTAVRLACEPDYRRAVSRRIAERCARLFDRPDTGAALGEALLSMAEAAR